MMRFSVASIVLSLAITAAADDALPPNAVARLGSDAFRHNHTVSALAYSADGKVLVSASWDRTARVWDAATGREISRFAGHADGATAVAISADGTLAASGDMKRTTVLWDARTGKELRRTAENPDSVFNLRFTPDGKRLIWSSARRVRVWDLAAWREERQIGAGDGVRPLALAPDGRTLAIGCNNGHVKIHRVDDGALVRTMEGHEKMVYGLAFSADGARLVSSASDGAIRVWDAATGQSIHAVTTAEEWAKPVAFLDGGRRFAAGGQDGSLRVWDTQTGAEAGRLRVSARNDTWVMALAVSPDGRTFATAGTEKAIRTWDARTLAPVGPDAAVDGHAHEIGSVAFVDGGRQIATASEDGRVVLWDARTGAKVAPLGDRALTGPALAASVDGKAVAVSSESPSLEVWDAAGRRRTVAVNGPLAAMHAVAITNDGALIAAACGHSVVRVIDGKTGADQFTVPIDPRLYEEIPLAFSPDGRLLAIGSGDPDKTFVRLIDAADGQTINDIAVRAGGYRSVAFSPDGATLAVASRRKPITLVEVQTGRPRATIEGDGDAGTCIAFSPDGRLIAAGGGPDLPTVRVWAVNTAKQVATFTGHKGWLKQLAFSPDSAQLVSASEDTTALVWDVSKLAREQPVAEPLDADAMTAAWAALADPDAAKAYAAIRRLATARGAANFLSTKLAATPPSDPQAVRQAMAELDNDLFARREAAEQALTRLGDAARPAIRAALDKGDPPDEVRTRLAAVLKRLNRPTGAPPERLRLVRAIEAMERAGAADALQRLARTDGPAADPARAAAARIGRTGR